MFEERIKSVDFVCCKFFFQNLKDTLTFSSDRSTGAVTGGMSIGIACGSLVLRHLYAKSPDERFV